MATTILWNPQSETSLPRPSWPVVAIRRLLAVALVLVGASMVARAQTVRSAEAAIAAKVVGALTGTRTYVWGARGSFYWGMGGRHARGLRITPDCSIAYVAGPLLIAFALLVLFRRLPAERVLIGAAIGVLVMVTLNLARIVLIAESIHIWDSEAAFWWSHVVVGTIAATVGNVAAIALSLRIAFGRRPRRARSTHPRPHHPVT